MTSRYNALFATALVSMGVAGPAAAEPSLEECLLLVENAASTASTTVASIGNGGLSGIIRAGTSIFGSGRKLAECRKIIARDKADGNAIVPISGAASAITGASATITSAGGALAPMQPPFDAKWGAHGVRLGMSAKEAAAGLRRAGFVGAGQAVSSLREEVYLKQASHMRIGLGFAPGLDQRVTRIIYSHNAAPDGRAFDYRGAITAIRARYGDPIVEFDQTNALFPQNDNMAMEFASNPAYLRDRAPLVEACVAEIHRRKPREPMALSKGAAAKIHAHWRIDGEASVNEVCPSVLPAYRQQTIAHGDPQLRATVTRTGQITMVHDWRRPQIAFEIAQRDGELARRAALPVATVDLGN